MSFMMKTENGYIPISGNNGGSANEISYDNTDSSLEAENVQEAIDEIVETKVDKTEILPTFTLAEYEEIKDTIPVGTKFAISDDEGGDDPTPTPSGGGLVEWFVIDETHVITFHNSGTQTLTIATGSGSSNKNTPFNVCFCQFFTNDTVTLGNSNGAISFTSGENKTYFNESIDLIIGFLKSDVEKYNIQQITL